MASSIPIAVEQLLESRVQEISRDGQETYVPQLSMSEKLAQLAHKIDFSKTLDQDEEESVDEDENDKPQFQPSLWPWDSVRNKLRNTLTNLCVLVDVLNVARDKKYLSLDTVSQGEAPPKPALRLLSKRKNFADASQILLQGMKDMACGLKQQQGDERDKNDFYAELMKLRQCWRLKKSGNLILGDLSYKSAGSKFPHSGAFQVKKDTNIDEERKSSLDVDISTDLLGFDEVQVNIRNEDFITSTSRVIRPCYPEGIAPWHRELCIAQNNLYCKELFAQLAHECYYSLGLAAKVVNNEIQTEIFPQTTLSITHIHRTDNEKEENMSAGELQDPSAPNVLDFAIHILLRQQYRLGYGHSTPRPVTSGIALRGNKKLRVAGPSCMVLHDVNQLKDSQRLLDKLINIAKHYILTRRVDRVIEELTEEIHDPLISYHWSSLSTETSSFGSVCIGLQERAERTCLAVKVDVDTIHLTQQNGVGVTFSADIQRLKSVLKYQVQLFMLELARKEAQRLGWYVRCNRFLGTQHGGKEHLVGLFLTFPEKEREILIEIAAPSNVQVKMKSPQCGESLPKILENEPRWSSMCRNYHSLNYRNIPGRTFLEKLTIMLLAS